MLKLLNKHSRWVKFLGTGTLLALTSSLAHASAFQIWEQNGAGTGDYHAGGAAIANDASTIFYNPAGLTRIHKLSVVGGAAAIPTKMEFRGASKTKLPTGIIPIPIANDSGTADGGGFRTSSNVAPFGYIAAPVNDRITVGIGVATPFGLTTDYSRNSVAAAYGTKTQMKDLDFMPSIGIKLNQHWSVGLGLDFNHLDATFNNDIHDENFTKDEFKSDNSGSATGWGAHAGILYQPTHHTRIGLTYHSPVHYDISGTSKGFQYDSNGKLKKHVENDHLKSSVTFPAFTMLSIYHDFTSKWAGMFSATYTQWHVFDELKLKNVANVVKGHGTFEPITIPQDFSNTLNLALGTHYQINHMWTLKGGVGYDMTPTDDDARNLRLPDSTRVAASLGAHLQVNQHVGLDLGYTRVFFHDTNVDIDDKKIGSAKVSTHGSVHSSANVIGLQLTWTL